MAQLLRHVSCGVLSVPGGVFAFRRSTPELPFLLLPDTIIQGAFDGRSLKALTKSTLCQTLKKPARQGRKLAGKGAYTDVSNRSLQVHLTQQAKIPSNFPLFGGIFAFAGFVSGLKSHSALEWDFFVHLAAGVGPYQFSIKKIGSRGKLAARSTPRSESAADIEALCSARGFDVERARAAQGLCP